LKLWFCPYYRNNYTKFKPKQKAAAVINWPLFKQTSSLFFLGFLCLLGGLFGGLATAA